MPLIDQGYYPQYTVKGALRKWRAFLFMGGVLEGDGRYGTDGTIRRCEGNNATYGQKMAVSSAADCALRAM